MHATQVADLRQPGTTSLVLIAYASHLIYHCSWNVKTGEKVNLFPKKKGEKVNEIETIQYIFVVKFSDPNDHYRRTMLHCYRLKLLKQINLKNGLLPLFSFFCLARVRMDRFLPLQQLKTNEIFASHL